MRALLLHPSFPEPYPSLYRILGARKAYLPPLGLITVAALLPEDWDLKLVDLCVQSITEEDWRGCEIVLVSAMGVQERQVLDLIRAAKSRGTTVVVGGGWAFHFSAQAIAHGADIVVRGEAEPVMEELLAKIKSREHGVVISSPDRTDMEKVPVPRFDLLDMSRYLVMAVQFSRGCPFSCEFCDVTNMLGHKVRAKQPDQIVAELESLHRLGWTTRVFVADDNFIGNPAKAQEMVERLIAWRESTGHCYELGTQVSVTLAKERQLLDLMVRAGFWKVCVGIESTDHEALREAKKLQNVAQDLDEACRIMNEAGLIVMATFMVGFDHEQPGVDRRIIDFAVRNHIAEVQVFPLRASPGTPLWKKLESQNRLLQTGGKNLGDQSALMNFVPARPPQEIVTELLNVIKTLYEPGAFLQRASLQLDAMKALPSGPSRRRVSLREIRVLVIALFRQALLYSGRSTFWRLLAQTATNGNLRLFLRSCAIGTGYFEFGKVLEAQLRQRLIEMNGK